MFICQLQTSQSKSFVLYARRSTFPVEKGENDICEKRGCLEFETRKTERGKSFVPKERNDVLKAYLLPDLM